VPRDPEDRMMSRAAIRQLLPRLEQLQFDVIHIHTPFVAHYAGLEIARKLRLPTVETYHTYFEHYLQHYVPLVPAPALRALSRAVTLRQCAQVDCVVSPSQPMANVLRQYGVRTPIHVIPTGLSLDRFRDGDRARFRVAHGLGERPVALFVGRVAHEKNIDFLLHMWPKVVERLPKAILVIAGEGPAESHIRQVMGRLNIEGSTRLIGYLDRHTSLLDCYRAADVFVFASRTETQGLVLLEAMAQGTPVVSTAVLGTAEVLKGAKGAVVAPESVEEFAARVVNVLSDPARHEQLGQAARADAARWASDRCARRLADVFSQYGPLQQAADAPALDVEKVA
jgi:glycosyltransferase involved in cell wall biosynthesis